MSPQNRFMPRWVGLGLALLLVASASAQNLLNNGDFESPLGPTNWVVQFSAPGISNLEAYGGPGDFAIADRSTEGSRVVGGFGGHLRGRTDFTTRAYFKQVVSNLTIGTTYHFSGYMKVHYNDTTNFFAFMEVVGGTGTPTADGRLSVRTENAISNRTQIYYTLDQTPDNNRCIEVRLRYVKYAMKAGEVSYPKMVKYSAYFDDIALTP